MPSFMLQMAAPLPFSCISEIGKTFKFYFLNKSQSWDHDGNTVFGQEVWTWSVWWRGGCLRIFTSQ